MAGMKIEVGKKYINAKGLIISIIHKEESGNYTYYCSTSSYLANGRYDRVYPSGKDLICEVVPEIYQTLINGWITQKQFLEKHIEHWGRVNAQ